METQVSQPAVLEPRAGKTADSWERSAVFPARIVVQAPPDERRHVQTLGQILYDVILRFAEDNAAELEDSCLLQEYLALVLELQILHHAVAQEPDLTAVRERLEAVLAEALAPLADHQRPGSRELFPKFPFRPFVLTLVRDEGFLKGVAVTEYLLEKFLGHAPSRAEQIDAWAEDLSWIQTVLARHLANRGEVASLGPGDSVLCHHADRLAVRLGEAIDLLRGEGGGEAEP